MYDPVELAREMESVVCRGEERKYYRFRSARFYGGIATADCLGCSLRCLFCWSWNTLRKADSMGHFHSPSQAARKLTRIDRRARFHQVRLSGNEPTLGKEHLLLVLREIPGDLRFILETNGILLGHDRDYARELSGFSNLHVRVSLKGAGEAEFSLLTGARPEGFRLQLEALENLRQHGVSCHPSIMGGFGSGADTGSLAASLREIGFEPDDIEIEELILYPEVERRLRKAGISVG